MIHYDGGYSSEKNFNSEETERGKTELQIEEILQELSSPYWILLKNSQIKLFFYPLVIMKSEKRFCPANLLLVKGSDISCRREGVVS